MRNTAHLDDDPFQVGLQSKHTNPFGGGGLLAKSSAAKLLTLELSAACSSITQEILTLKEQNINSYNKLGLLFPVRLISTVTAQKRN